MIALPLGLVAVLSAVIALTGQGADSVLRHLYLVPTVWVALGWGTVGGGLVGALAGLLHAPVVLPAVERQGITSQTLDGLLSLGLPVLTGLLVGYLADGARARAARLSAVLAIQRRLTEPGPLEAALTGVAQELRASRSERAASRCWSAVTCRPHSWPRCRSVRWSIRTRRAPSRSRRVSR